MATERAMGRGREVSGVMADDRKFVSLHFNLFDAVDFQCTLEKFDGVGMNFLGRTVCSGEWWNRL